jgi:tRNA (adenine57-N1/adenine58-N1)-methyltransferase catalytic subunit
MYETLQRPHDVSQIPALPSVREAAEKLKQSEQRREEKRLRQIAQNKVKFSAAGPRGSKRKGDGDRDSHEGSEDVSLPVTAQEKESDNNSGGVSARGSSKKLKTANFIGPDDFAMSDQTYHDAAHHSMDSPRPISSSSHLLARTSVSKACPEVRGHTSYLTFAYLLPFYAVEPALNILPAGASDGGAII